MLCNLSYWASELHGSVATWPSLSSYALRTELLGLLSYVASWLLGFLSYSAFLRNSVMKN